MLTRQHGEAVDRGDRLAKERESSRKEMEKLHDQLRKFKEDTIKNYATYNDQCSSEHQEAERRITKTEQENARVRQENDSLLKS